MALESLRKNARLGDVPLTYAGRLDPMASGKLLVLIGDECKRRSFYDGLDKEYEVEILFGLSSDTGDILGLVERCDGASPVSETQLVQAARNVRGSIVLPYPAYSSKPVGGKPLFEHARTGSIDSIEIPNKSSRVYTYALESLSHVDSRNLLDSICTRLGLLAIDTNSANPYKDFRKTEIVARWQEILAGGDSFQIAKIRCTVSSGTYMRSLVPRIAETLGTCALACSIRRTRIGRFIPFFGTGLWAKSY